MSESVWARLREWIKPQTNANAGLNWDLEEAADRGEALERVLELVRARCRHVSPASHQYELAEAILKTLGKNSGTAKAS
jgi:hypothetical protein